MSILADLGLTSAAKWRVVAHTQVWENYGAHEWDGEGECPQYWKPKGGRDIVLATFDTAPSSAVAGAIADQWQGEDSEGYSESMLDWSILAPGDLTPSEQDRLYWANLTGATSAVEELRRIQERQVQMDLLEEQAHRFGRA